MRKPIIRIAVFLFVFTASGLLLFGKEELFHFLAPTDRVDASVLVIEGWISEEALQQAVEEIEKKSYEQVLVTSIAHDSAFRMYSQGALIFRLADIKNYNESESFQEVKILSFGNPAGGVQAHAKVLVDTVQVGEFTTTDTPAWHRIPIPAPTSADSVIIVYDNDKIIEKEDRDLFVYKIQLDSISIPARHPVVRYDRGKLDGQNVLRTDYQSEAEEATKFIINQGVDSELVHTLTAPWVDYERTFTTAQEVKKWLPDTISAITLISESVHARRSRLVYQRIFGDSTKVGIIAANSKDYQPHGWWTQSGSRQYVLLQLAKYLYTKAFLFP